MYKQLSSGLLQEAGFLMLIHRKTMQSSGASSKPYGPHFPAKTGKIRLSRKLQTADKLKTE